MQEKVKYCLAIFGLGHLLAMSITMALAWYCAWFSGQYACVITINDWGEALLEFFLIPIALIWGLYGIGYFMLRKVC